MHDIVSVMQDKLEEITDWLNSMDLKEGPQGSAVGNELFVWLYQDLHRMAHKHMRREHPGHTLSATALTHEAWFRMGEQTRTRWASRAHFLAVASTAMRRILLHHAAAKQALKREAELVSLTWAEEQPGPVASQDIVAIHEALLAFEAIDPRAAKVVELRFFGGMENGEIAEALAISVATVKREWNVARAWLLRELERDAGS